jgi:hypothetical protein
MFLRNVVATQQTTRRHIPEDDTLYNHRCGNVKSYILVLIPPDSKNSHRQL